MEKHEKYRHERGRDREGRDRPRERERDEKKYEYGKQEKFAEPKAPPIEKEKPSLELSGNLAKDTNVFNGVVVKYNEPPEARKPRKRWRLYCFKGDTELPFYPMHRQSAYLFGRDRKVADIPTDHPSCSSQHAVFQHRLVEYKRKDGTTGRTIKPYIIDLGSTNGTYVNNQQIEAQRYFELREKDVLKFGYSSREYILLHEESKNDLNEFGEDSGEEAETTENEKEEPVVVKKEKVDEEPVAPKAKNKKARSSSSESSSSSDSESESRKKKKSKK